jgi:hypothetical protein
MKSCVETMGGRPGILRDHRSGPRQRGIRRVELEADMEEAVSPRLEHLRAVCAALMRSDIPGLAFEEGRIGPELGPEIAEPARMPRSRTAGMN